MSNQKRIPVSLLLPLLLVLAAIFLPARAVTPVVNANALKTTSSVGAFEFEATLQSNDADPEDDVIIFRWNTPSGGNFEASLEYTTKVAESRPSWISLGFVDQNIATSTIAADSIDSIGGQAIVGSLFFGNREIFKYFLGNPHGGNTATNSNGGVDIMPDEFQGLVDENLEQGVVNLSDGTVAYRTELNFIKKMQNGGNSVEVDIHSDIDNYFVWALGQYGDQQLAMHRSKGAFRMLLGEPADSSGTTSTAGTSATTAAPAPTTATGDTGSTGTSTTRTILNATANFKSVTEGPNSNFDRQVELDSGLTLYWKDPNTEGVFEARLEHTADNMTSAPSWLSFGFYDVIGNPRPITPQNFVMDGSTAIVGLSWVQNEEDPKVYRLGYNHDQPGVIQPINSSHLIESYFSQLDNEQAVDEKIYTTLTFKMSMKNPTPNEPTVIAAGDDVFMWAMGPPGADSLNMHKSYGALHLDLAAVRQTTNTDDNNPHVALINVIDGTSNFAKSPEPNFDFQVQLQEGLIFHWQTPRADTGIFTGRLQHTTKYVEAAPAWLGFGFPNPSDKSTWMLMKDTYAIIGQLPSEKVQKYSLGANNNHTNGFVQPLPADLQTLEAAKIIQNHNPDTGILTTTLTFSKLMVEPKNPSESPISVDGDNMFLWAVGNVLTGTPNQNLGMHRDFGGLKINFAEVAKKGSVPEQSGSSGSTTDSDGGDEFLAPEIIGQCSSSVFEKSGKSIKLTPDITMHWTLNDLRDEGFAAFGEVPSVTILIEYEGLAWIGFGFSNSARAHSLGSSAVIGVPSEKSGEPQLKYNITGTEINKIVPLSEQTLIESSVKQSGGRTTLRFTKALQDGRNEVAIEANGYNYFSYAVGNGNSLGYHRHRGSFRLDLSECYDGPPDYRPSGANREESKGNGALTAHAVLAAIAWGFSMPCAVAMAWFRQMIPTTWIYVHVSFNLLTFVLTLLAIMLGIGAVSARETSSHFTKGHHWMGLLLFVGYTFQVANGFLRPPVTRKEDGTPVERKPFSMEPPQSARELWHMVHRSIGILMLLAGIFQIASGMDLYDENFRSGRNNFFWYWTYISLFALCIFFLKIYLILKGRRTSGTGNWFEDRAATSVGIDNAMMTSDPDGMDFDGNMVLEIPSRSGEPTVIRGARRMNSPSSPPSQRSSASDLEDDIDEIHLDDTENDDEDDFEQLTTPEIT